jgi:hypothetical protein
MQKRKSGEPNPIITCGCGCGQTLLKYNRWGEPRMFIHHHRPPLPDNEYLEKAKKRFWAKVFKRGENDCWEWQSVLSHDGYGRIWFHGKFMGAHRFSWMIHNENTNPGDQQICHVCDNPICVNPNHLFLGTNKDNMQDRIAKVGWRKTTAQLTPKQVSEIRTRYQSENIPSRQLGREYGVSKTQILRIINKKSWQHVQSGIDYGYGFIPDENQRRAIQ